jgi:hypothetical protein
MIAVVKVPLGNGIVISHVRLLSFFLPGKDFGSHPYDGMMIDLPVRFFEYANARQDQSFCHETGQKAIHEGAATICPILYGR